MADKEYSDSFTIVKSSDGVVRVVSNRLSMQILNILSSAPCSLTDLSVKTTASKTTVQSNLVILEQMGLIRPHTNKADNRSMIYDRTCDQLYDTEGTDWN